MGHQFDKKMEHQFSYIFLILISAINDASCFSNATTTTLSITTASITTVATTTEATTTEATTTKAIIDKSRNYTFYLYQYGRDCQEAECASIGLSRELKQLPGLSDNYYIKPDGLRYAFKTYCNNSENDGVAWTVIQRRDHADSDNLDFNKSWTDYRDGFGISKNNFWIGNEKLSYLTNQRRYRLRIDLMTSNGTWFNVTYDNFRISDEFSGYKLVAMDNGPEDDVVQWCPTNMQYGYCRQDRCERTCADRDACQPCQSELELCLCPDGYLMSGDNCVPEEDCGSCPYKDAGITFRMQDGSYYVSSDCTRNCSCIDGSLHCQNSQCSPDASCEEREDDAHRKCYCNERYVGNGTHCRYVSDCLELFEQGMTESGLYTIQPMKNDSRFEVYCDMEDGGGWTVFQKRVNGSVKFFRPWEEYAKGFGLRGSEFWLGNDRLYILTNQRRYELKIELTDTKGALHVAQYDLFRISNEKEHYTLAIGNYTGDAGDSLTNYSSGQPFTIEVNSTIDEYIPLLATIGGYDEQDTPSDLLDDISYSNDFYYSSDVQGVDQTNLDNGRGRDSSMDVPDGTNDVIGPWWHPQEMVPKWCDLNGDYADIYWHTVTASRTNVIRSTTMKIRPTVNNFN